jgi:hypothetical protein
MYRVLKSPLPALTLVLLTVGGPAGWLAFHKRAAGLTEQTSASPAFVAARTEMKNSATGMGLRFQPRENQRYIYSFKRKIIFHGLAAGKTPEVAYHGEFFIDVLHVDLESFEALITDRVAEYGHPSPVALRLRMDTRGDHISLAGTATATPLQSSPLAQHEAILKDLVANWAFPLQSDTLGEYEARFEPPASEDGLTRIRKTKLSYRDPSPRLPHFVHSNHLLIWDEALALPREIQGDETTKMSQGQWEMSSESEYQMRLLAIETAPASTKNTLTALTQDESLTPASNTRRKPGSGDGDLPSWSVVLASLQQLADLTPDNRLKIFGDLLRLLRAGAISPDDAIALINNPDTIKAGPLSPLFKTVIGALASLGTPEAQAAVVQIYQDPNCPTAGKGSILVALTTTQATLTPSTRTFLGNEMSNATDPDLAHGAAYAVGAALQNVTPDAQSAATLAMVHQLWQSNANNSSEQSVLLDVIGNSGQGEYLPELEGVITSGSDPSLTAKAVFALRFMTSDVATQIIATNLSNSDVRIREAAVSAIQAAKWNSDFSTPLQACAKSETVTSIQSTCQSILAQNGA